MNLYKGAMNLVNAKNLLETSIDQVKAKSCDVASSPCIAQSLIDTLILKFLLVDIEEHGG